MSELGERIRAARRGRSQKDFAAAYGIHMNTLRRYEDGEREPSHEFLQNLIQTENLCPEWVITGEGAMYKDEASAPPKKAAEVARPDVRDEYIACLRQLADLQKENGDLRVKAAQLESRNAELERQLAEALKPAQPASMGGGISKVG